MQTGKIRHAVLLFTILATVGACKKGTDKSDELFDSTATKTANGPIAVSATDNSYSVMVPARWLNLYRVDSLSTAERGTARPGVLNFVYLPRDTTQLPQTLIVVAVYDSIAWQKVKAAGGPPPGDSVAAGSGRVYVLALPQSNPFSPGSADAVKFDSLALTAGEKSALLKLNPAAIKK
ncbi:MAG: hypothetical protein ABJC26_18960 [Gemmatimonadaceae bacterium]